MGVIQVLAYILGFFVFLVVTQDIHIFPGAFISKALFWRRNKSPPPNIESIFIESTDRTRIELWRHAEDRKTELSEHVAIIFHGNGGTLENFQFVQMWLSQMGIISYNFDYRGYGRSSGWPSEGGIYSDSDAVWDYVTKREKIDPKKVIVVGISVGSAPAARIAAMYQPKLLLLVSAFTSLRSAVQAQLGIGFLAPFIRHKFRTIDYLRELKSTDVILVHGLSDRIVPLKHVDELREQYQGSGRVQVFRAEGAGHNMALYAVKNEVAKHIREVLSQNSIGSIPRSPNN